MSKPWGGVGAWALDAERAEEEEREQQAVAATIAIAGEPANSFPSLKEAAATKPKKKKPVSMPLSQFNASAFPSPKSHDVDLQRLPTAPRERGPDDPDYSRGFRSYGAGGGPTSDRRSYGGGFDDDQRRPPRDQDLDLPSRADEVDNWASEKKSFASAPGRTTDRYSSLSAPGGGPSRADDVDNWAAGKKAPPSRYPSFGTGYRDTPASSDPDRWARGAPPSNGDRERPKLVLAPPKVDFGAPAEAARSRPSPFGAARPREEVLKEKGLDWRKLDAEPGRPTSSHSSRPSSAQSSRPGSPRSQASGAEGAAAPVRPKVNPFGDAKPREVLLQERGKDWRKIDLKLEHGRVDRPETDEEKLLKEEINNLNQALTKETEANPNDNSSQEFMEKLTSLREQKKERENQLELLICELDDKVRFGQRSSADIRPGSGAGRVTSSSDRPPQPGMFEESRSMEFTERPRSRGGMGDAWAKPMDERRRGGRESSYFGSRNVERPKSREGW